MQFGESKHPRDKDGKFTDGNGTTKEAYDSRDTFGNMIATCRKAQRSELPR